MNDYRTWMENTPQIRDKKLKHICLPGSHDSGTHALTSTLTPNPSPDIKKVMDEVRKIEHAIDKIPLIGMVINPARWVRSAVLPAIKGLSTTTTKTIAQQLDDGIRCFDLRIYYNAKDEQFYTYHGLVGTKITDILQDFGSFLSTANGEIVYVTMGHWESCDNKYNEFSELVKDKLGMFAYVRESDSSGRITNNPFEKTYADIVGQDGQERSRVILVNEKSADPVFWPKSYSPPDNSANGAVIGGYYTETTNVATMIKTQQERFDQAKAKLPFALYMTLTPGTDDAVKVVVSSLSSAIAKLAAGLLLTLYAPIGIALEAIAAGLKIYEWTLDWTTLKELSRKVNKNIYSTVTDKFQKLSENENNISFIYLDFYESTDIVDLAIQYSILGSTPSHIPIYQCHAVQANGDGWRHFYSASLNIRQGWIFDGISFFGFAEQKEGTVPIYQYHAVQKDGDGWRFFYSTGADEDGDWISDGVAFYAYPEQVEGAVPIYQYHAVQANGDGWRFFYSANPHAGMGWTRDKIAFYTPIK